MVLRKVLNWWNAVFIPATVLLFIYMFGWEVVVFLLPCMLVHEAGHLWRMGREGMRVKGLYFVVFGLVAVPEEGWDDLGAEGRLAIAGPVFGMLATYTLAILAMVFCNPVIGTAAYYATLINIFNLLFPIYPLDGARVLRALLPSSRGFRLCLGGVGLLAGLLVWRLGFGLFPLLIALLGASELNETPYRTPATKGLRLRLAGVYIGTALAFFLLLAMFYF